MQSRHFLFLVVPLISVCAGRAAAQTLTNDGASITVKAGASLTIRGSLSNNAARSIANSGTVSVTGNTANNGTYTSPVASTLNLAGSTAQTLGGTAPISAKNVVVNNAAGVTLNTPLNVDGAMTFTSGIITATTSNAPVVFSANASVSGTPTDASHVNGYVQKAGTGAFTFPVGDAGKYQPVGVNISTGSGGITARYYATDAGSFPFGTTGSSSTPLLYYNKKEYWDLVPTGSPKGTITTWSPFTLGSIFNTSPLPLKLVAFSAVQEGTANRVNWKTATEDPGTVFYVERAANGRDFETMSSIDGKGTGSSYGKLLLGNMARIFKTPDSADNDLLGHTCDMASAQA